MNVDEFSVAPRRTSSLLPHCGHEDMDPLSLLRALISLIPPTHESVFSLFACSALYICTKPRLHSAFSFSASGAACPVFVSQQVRHLFSSVAHRQPLCCFKIHTDGTETTWLHARCKIAFTLAFV